MITEEFISTLKVFPHPTDSDKFAIEFTQGEFTGIVYSIGKVWLPEDTPEPTLSFDYDVISETKPGDLTKFQNTIGEILLEMIKKSIAQETTVYAGGTGPYIEDEPTESKIYVPDQKIYTGQ